MKSFGPMHGERTQRHQEVVQGGNEERGGTIVTAFELPPSEKRPEPLFQVEFMAGLDMVVARFTPEQARAWGRAFLAYADTWAPPGPGEEPPLPAWPTKRLRGP